MTLFRSGRGNHDERPFQRIELLRIGGLTNVFETREPKRILPVLKERPGAFVKALRMSAKYRRNVHRQGAVHKDGERRDALLIGQLMQQQDNLLGAADRE